MSDLNDEVKKDLTEDPLADAVNKIAEHVVESEKRSKEVVEDLKKELADHKDSTAKGFVDAAEGIDRMRKNIGQDALSAIRLQNTTDPLIESMSDHAKKGIGRFQGVIGHLTEDKDSLLRRPEVAAATTRWFQLSTRLQHRSSHGQSGLAEEFERLNRGFADMGSRVLKAASALQEDTATEGGHLVPTIVDNEIQRQVLDAGRIFPLARQMALNVKTTKLPAESAAVTTYWVDEEAAMTRSEPTFSQLTLTAEKIASTAKMSIELVEDSNVGLLPWLLNVFTEKMAAELDKQVAAGDGSGPAITGIANGASVVAVTSGTAAGRALTYPLLVQCYMGASQANTRDNGVWICTPGGFQELLELTDGNGRPLVSLTGAEVRGPAPMTLFGKRIIESASAGGAADPSLDDNTNTNTTILFGPMNSYVFGTRQGMRWDVTDQVSWANYQMDARLVGRYAGVPGVSKNFTKLTHITTA